MISDNLRLMLDNMHAGFGVRIGRPQSSTTIGMLPIADLSENDEEYGLSKFANILADSRFQGHVLATGSRVYGVARPESDYDLVILTPFAPCWTEEQFKTHCDPDSSGVTSPPPGGLAGDGYPEYGLTGSYRFGPVNVIHCNKRTQWVAWFKGTEFLYLESKKEGPRSRTRAIHVFEEMRRKYCGRPAQNPNGEIV